MDIQPYSKFRPQNVLALGKSHVIRNEVFGVMTFQKKHRAAKLVTCGCGIPTFDPVGICAVCKVLSLFKRSRHKDIMRLRKRV